MEYVRRKTTLKQHQYRAFNVDGATISWIMRHRKDCSRCWVEPVRNEQTPPLKDMKHWILTVAPAITEAVTLVPRIYEAAEVGNVGLASHYLTVAGTTLTEVPVSPDSGRTAEYLAMAGDAYIDAEYAYSHGDGVGAGNLIFYAEQLLRKAQEVLSSFTHVHAA